MTSIAIREAEPADCDTIVEFNRRLARETEEKDLPLECIRPGVARLLENARLGRYFVACDSDQVIGQLMHTWEWSDWRNGEIWWLQSVYVHQEYRRQGIFRRLYEHVRQLADASADVVGLRLYVERENARAQDTYRSLGMELPGYFVMEELFKSNGQQQSD